MYLAVRRIVARKPRRRCRVSSVLPVLLVELVALAREGVDAALVVDQQLRAVEDHDVVLERHPFGIAVLN